ncbi:hypothetical protein [Rhodopseudomonas sp.]|nr:hypothetical protein [Rhodopseudomonas sp.]
MQATKPPLEAAQGYLYSMAVPPEEIAQLLERLSAKRAASAKS